MIVRNNQGSFYNTLGSTGGSLSQSSITGRVFHIVIDENSAGFNDWSSIGDTYYVEKVDIHSQHTKIELRGVVGRFNSVCFEIIPK